MPDQRIERNHKYRIVPYDSYFCIEEKSKFLGFSVWTKINERVGYDYDLCVMTFTSVEKAKIQIDFLIEQEKLEEAKKKHFPIYYP